MQKQIPAVLCVRASEPKMTMGYEDVCNRCQAKIWVSFSSIRALQADGTKISDAEFVCFPQCITTDEMRAAKMKQPTNEQITEMISFRNRSCGQ
jgi:hypothetical protein